MSQRARILWVIVLAILPLVALNGFLDVAHLQIGRPLELERSRADLAALVREAVQEQQHLTARHRIAYVGPGALPADIDGARLQRALLAVEDRGIGIPSADLERIFARFERGANVAGRFSGTGIGLAIARQIVEQHGGSLSVHSAVGEGSTFTLQFPSLREPGVK